MRAAAAGVCAVLLAALALAPGMGLPAHASRAEAADCVWSRHAKRVVKHVRRHGRAHRIVRTRRWWSCDAVPAAPVANLAPAPQAPAAAPKSEPEANRVGVGAHDQAGDFGYVLTRPQVRAGKVTVELNNQGEDPTTSTCSARAKQKANRSSSWPTRFPPSRKSPALNSPPGPTGSGAASPNTTKKACTRR